MNQNMHKKIKNIAIALCILITFAFICFIIYEVNDFINDYKFSNMLINKVLEV